MTGTPLLPHFIVIGAMKCGTTTIYRHLSDHPNIDMSRDKETDFFLADEADGRGLDWCSGQFSGRDAVRGEASPNYTKRRDFPGVPARIAAQCPDVRLVYILRDPVARAESQFRHGVIMGDIEPTIEAFIDEAKYAHIMDVSRYAHQLDAYLDHFSRDAILVLDFDDLQRDPQRLMDRIHAHVGVRPRTIGTAGSTNNSRQLSRIPPWVLRFAQSPTGRRIAGTVGRGTRDRIRGLLARGSNRRPPPLPEELIEQMRLELAPDVARLRESTGHPFETWSV